MRTRRTGLVFRRMTALMAGCLIAAALTTSALARAPTQDDAGALGATVDSLLAAGRALSPQLRAAALETRAAAAKAETAGALDDPMFSENYQNYRSGGLFSMHFLTVTQTFPLWGKRDLRYRAALAEVDVARGRERTAQDELDEQIKVAYARYYAFTRAIAVNKDITALVRQMRDAAATRYGQGGGDQAGLMQ